MDKVKEPTTLQEAVVYFMNPDNCLWRARWRVRPSGDWPRRCLRKVRIPRDGDQRSEL